MKLKALFLIGLCVLSVQIANASGPIDALVNVVLEIKTDGRVFNRDSILNYVVDAPKSSDKTLIYACVNSKKSRVLKYEKDEKGSLIRQPIGINVYLVPTIPNCTPIYIDFLNPQISIVEIYRGILKAGYDPNDTILLIATTRSAILAEGPEQEIISSVYKTILSTTVSDGDDVQEEVIAPTIHGKKAHYLFQAKVIAPQVYNSYAVSNINPPNNVLSNAAVNKVLGKPVGSKVTLGDYLRFLSVYNFTKFDGEAPSLFWARLGLHSSAGLEQINQMDSEILAFRNRPEVKNTLALSTQELLAVYIAIYRNDLRDVLRTTPAVAEAKYGRAGMTYDEYRLNKERAEDALRIFDGAARTGSALINQILPH